MFFKSIATAARMGSLKAPAPAHRSVLLDTSMLNTVLALALDTRVTNQPDFVWMLNQPTGIITIHHPDPAVQSDLNHGHLTGVLDNILANSGPYTPAGILAHAISNRLHVANLEIEWLETGRANWWQISVAPACEHMFPNGAMIGIVRDITAAQQFCGQLIDSEVRHNRLRKSSEQLGNVLASCLRQQINVIANVAEDYCGPNDLEENHHLEKRPGLRTQMRSTVSELLMISSLVRDYADAMGDCLKIDKSETVFDEVVDYVVNGLAGRVERPGAKLVITRTHDMTPIDADLARLRKLVHILANQTADLATTGSAIKLDISTSRHAELVITMTYCGQDPATTRTMGAPILNGDIFHPTLAHEFIERVLQAHHAELKFTKSASGEHSISLRLPSTKGEHKT